MRNKHLVVETVAVFNQLVFGLMQDGSIRMMLICGTSGDGHYKSHESIAQAKRLNSRRKREAAVE